MDTQRIVVELVESGLAGCGHLVAGHGGLLASLFLAGLAVSASHCAGMCGPFVLAQVGTRLAAMPLQRATLLTRLSGMALLPYHLGRATTYTALGAVAGGLFGGVEKERKKVLGGGCAQVEARVGGAPPAGAAGAGEEGKGLEAAPTIL